MILSFAWTTIVALAAAAAVAYSRWMWWRRKCNEAWDANNEMVEEVFAADSRALKVDVLEGKLRDKEYELSCAANREHGLKGQLGACENQLKVETLGKNYHVDVAHWLADELAKHRKENHYELLRLADAAVKKAAQP